MPMTDHASLKLFVNYRRADEAVFVELLRTHFMFRYQRENVFMDFDSIPPFTQFEDFIRLKVRESDVLVAIIGPRWLELMQEKAAKGEPDYVRIELEEALKQNKVIAPILIQGASVPPEQVVPEALRPLLKLNIPTIRAGRDLLNNIGWIMDGIENALAQRGTPKAARPGAVPDPVQTATTPNAPPLSIDDLLDRYTIAFEAQDDPQALIWIAEMRAHGGVPDKFQIDRRQTMHQTRLKAAEEQRRRREVAAYLYKFAQRMMRLKDDPDDIRAMLEEVWVQEPGYDPDGIAGRLPQSELVDFLDFLQQETPPPPPDPAQQAIQAARTFSGRRNKAWTPFIAVFPTLKIPDMRFCLVPVGKFQMGSKDGKYYDEEPQHPQRMTAPYWIAQYPVTNAQWALAVRAGVVKEPEEEVSLNWYQDKAMAEAPVVGVTWFMARDFAAWVGARLPSEREWEFAARGVESLRYTWGNDWDETIPVWNKNSGGKPAIVTSKPEGVSWVGAHHLIGNVWEWTGSLYLKHPYPDDGSREADTVNRTDVRRALRGGSWWNLSSDILRAACRTDFTPDNWDDDRGFRLALSQSFLIF